MLNFMRENKQFFAKFLFLFLGLSFVNSSFAALAEQKSADDAYSKAAKFYLPSQVNKERLENEIAKKIKDENEKHQKDVREKNESALGRAFGRHVSEVVKIADLGEVEMQKLVYQIFSASKSESEEDFDKVLLNDCVFDDIELFCGSSSTCPEKSVFSQIDRTVTPFGRAKLQSYFTENFDTVDQLTKKIQKRQEIVKHLIENQELFDKLDQKLHEVSKNMAELMLFFKPMEDSAQKSINQFYAMSYGEKINTFLNEKPLAYKAYNFTFATIMITLLAALTIGSGSVGMHAGGCSFSKQWGFIKGKFNEYIMDVPFAKKNVCISGSFLGMIVLAQLFKSLSNFKNLNPGLMDLFCALVVILQIIQFHGEIGGFLGGYGEATYKVCRDYPILPIALVLYTALTGFGIYVNRVSAKSAAEAIKQSSMFIDKQVCGVTGLTQSVSDIGEICRQDDVLENEFKVLSENLTNGSDFEQMEALFADLSHLSEKLKDAKLPIENDGYFSLTKSKVRSAFKKMQRLKDGFVESMKTIGELDACMSIAKLYKEYAKNPNVKYCFVNFIDADSPSIKIQDFWFPTLDSKYAVPNDIELGTPTAGHNMILTGPNAAGKSTALRGIIGALILAQTIGLAPASKMAITPFTRINSHLNISDNVGRESLYQAEKNRVKNFLNELKQLKDGEFEFSIMDEMFSSTNPEEGQSAAYAIAKSLVKTPNCMCLLATHFKKLADLEADTNGYYKNYKVYVDALPDGKFRCPYKLVPGISNQNVAILMMKQDFDSEIVDEAFDILSQIKEDTSDIVGFQQNKKTK